MQELVKSNVRGVIVTTLEELAGEAEDYARASRARTTLISYESDFRAFELWCLAHGLEALPASPATVAAYLPHLAKRLKASSIGRHVASIRYRHKLAGYEPPTSSEAVKAVLSGIRRELGTAPTRKAPATAEAIGAMIAGLEEEGLRGMRDRALLLLGFAGALRRSELVALDVDDLDFTAEGLRVLIRRSKTDQEGAGQEVAIPDGRLHVPGAIQAWLEAAGIVEGAIFRQITRAGQVQPWRLSGHAAALIVKGRAAAAGFQPGAFSGHSLRAGFVTSALQARADVLRIMHQTRHKEVKTLAAYDRRVRAFEDHAGEGFL